MKKGLLVVSILLGSIHAHAAEIPGLSDLFNQAGCFDLNYMFLEDGPNPGKSGEDPFYTFKSTSTEWVTVTQDETDPNNVRIERFFSFAHGGPEVIAHHHAEDWTFNPVSKSWKQHVFFYKDLGASTETVDRYTCDAPWNLHQRTCEAKLAMKPQRHKYAGRNYQGLDRNHTEQVTPFGWVQVSHNFIRNETKKDGTVADAAEVGWIENKKRPGITSVAGCFPNVTLSDYAKSKLEN